MRTIRDIINSGARLYKNRPAFLAKEVKEMAGILANQIDTSIFNTQIRSSVSVAEAPAQGESIYDYAPNCKPAADYRLFVDEVITRIREQEVV